jgi:putative acetyltransferase
MGRGETSIRLGEPRDQDGLIDLLKAAAGTPDLFARGAQEIDAEFVRVRVSDACERGVWLVAEDLDSGMLAGSVHALRPKAKDASHVLGDVLLAVHPRAQGRGLGSALFGAFVERVRQGMPEIQRIELLVRESNVRAAAVYERHGFRKEGRLVRRLRRFDGAFEDSLFYAWLREAPSGGGETRE